MQSWLWRGFGILAVLSLNVSPAAAETLREALVRTLRVNPTLGAQQAGLRATRELLPQARAGFLPRITANADVTYQRDTLLLTTSTSGALPQTAVLSRRFGVSLTQSLFDGGHVSGLVGQAGAQTAGAEETLRDATQAMLASVAASYRMCCAIRSFAASIAPI